VSRQLSFDELSSAPGPNSVAESTRIHEPPLTVNVIRSAKRKKSSQARLRGNELEVRVPAWMSVSEENKTVNNFIAKFERARRTDQVDLTVRAGQLAACHDLPEPESIRWVSNQANRWGSCTPADGAIRISDRLSAYPDWVLDYVIVHELAHLVECNHSQRFWDLVSRYSLTERARGFLIAKGHDGD